MGYLRYVESFDSAYLRRPEMDDSAIESSVRTIIDDVRERGDEALREYEKRFDNTELDELFVSEEEIDEAEKKVPESLKDAIRKAAGNIAAFHRAQMPEGEAVETEKGVLCSRRIVPIEKVGLYIPGGTAPLFSTVLMLAIPASIAGCSDIMLSTPAKDGAISPAILYAARISGVTRILKAGGAQAIAALAYGTESVPRRDKIFGPGNRFVSMAKMMVSKSVAIDMLAGPSEVLVIADETADPAFVSSDLLSQAEHGRDSQAMLMILADSKETGRAIYESVERELGKHLGMLSRSEYLLSSLSSSAAFFFSDKKELMDAVNEYAPEHLIINTADPDDLLSYVRNAGSVFLGPYSPESAGDYASGTNHTLPTSGWAVSSSGVSVDSFIKKITVQRLSREGIGRLEPVVYEMAMAEGLEAHALAARIRVDGRC